MALTPDEARALHDEVSVIDLHADTPKLMDKLGYDFTAHHDRRLPRQANILGHVDIPRMREGGVAAQFMALWSWPKYVPTQTRSEVTSVLNQLDAVQDTIDKHPDQLAWARTGADIRAAKAAGKIAVLGGIEGGHALEGKLENIEMFSRRGVRYLGPLHLWPSALGSSSRQPKKDAGLTDLGREVIRECERCGVIVDLSHMSTKSYAEALEIVTRPPMVSHTGVVGVHEHWRNIDDAQIRAVADRGGCIGIIFARNYLGGKSIECVVDHVMHVIDIAGEDVAALGSDFDGFVVPPEGLEDIAAMPNLTVALSRRGVPPRVLEKILSHNALRVLDAVPAFGSLAA
jgi:membrane dipeptidase